MLILRPEACCIPKDSLQPALFSLLSHPWERATLWHINMQSEAKYTSLSRKTTRLAMETHFPLCQLLEARTMTQKVQVCEQTFTSKGKSKERKERIMLLILFYIYTLLKLSSKLFIYTV